MANETSNVLAVLRNLLLQDSAVVGLVSNRIRTTHIADPDSVPITYPFVILSVFGGASRYNGHLMNTSVEVYVYSKTGVDEALAIYEQIFRVFQAARLYRSAIATRGVVRETDRPRDGFHDGLVAWYVRATYDVISAA